MSRNKLKLWLSLSLIGFIGVLFMLFSDLVLISEQLTVLNVASHSVMRLLKVLNFTIILLIAALVGSFVYNKVGLKVPVLEKFLKIRDHIPYTYKSIFIWGSVGGIVVGLLIVIVNFIFMSQFTSELSTLSQGKEFNIVSCLLYGGLGEKILIRFELMSLLTVWLYSYMILANGIAGVIFGYMYMKRGLECVMWTYLITHVILFLIT